MSISINKSKRLWVIGADLEIIVLAESLGWTIAGIIDSREELVGYHNYRLMGDGVKVNYGANIMHDCTLGNYVTVGPNAVLLGYVTVGSGSFIGANSTILPHCKVGSNVTVGAGAVLTKDVGDGVIVKGVPAK